MKISKIRRLLILLAVVAWVLPAPAAKVEYSPRGVLSFSESTPWGDMTAVFRYCLANELFTFSTVSLDGRRVNTGDWSDNIGPFSVDGNWLGGNHIDGKGKRTAVTMDVEIRADEIPLDLDEDSTVDCKILKINVTNLVGLADVGLFARERVAYTVAGNSIEVEVEHEYICNATVTVATYYGMQSMFDGEDKLLIPGTRLGCWIPVDNSVNLEIYKREAPDMHLFIESNGHAMQASYLMDEDLGTHELITDARNVFVHAGGKSYHSLMRYNKVEQGTSGRWHGVYSWFREPVKDTFVPREADPCVTYGAYIGGAPYLVTAYDDGRVTTERYIRPVEKTYDSGCRVFDAGMTESDTKPGTSIFDVTGRLLNHDTGINRLGGGIYIVNGRSGSKKVRVR